MLRRSFGKCCGVWGGCCVFEEVLKSVVGFGNCCVYEEVLESVEVCGEVVV